MNSIMSCANSHDMIYLFLILTNLSDFNCLMAVAKTSKTMLNKSGQSEQPYLVSNLKEVAFSCSPLLRLLVVYSRWPLIL